MLSKAVPGDQLGQVFSVLASLESVVPLASTSIFNLVYEATLQSFTGTVYAVEAGCYVALVFLMAYVRPFHLVGPFRPPFSTLFTLKMESPDMNVATTSIACTNWEVSTSLLDVVGCQRRPPSSFLLAARRK